MILTCLRPASGQENFPEDRISKNLKIYLLPVSSIVKVIKLTFCNEAESIVDKLCKLKKSKRKRKTENSTYFTLLFYSNFFSILDVTADNYFIRDKITYDCCKQVLATKYYPVRQNLYPTWTSP